MDPISIAFGLAQFAPSLIKWLSGSDKAADVAQKAIEIAQTVTGTSDAAAAQAAMIGNPDLALKFRQAVLDNDLEFQKLANANASEINETMRAEAQSEHWPTYTWRPAIGLAVAFDLIICTLVVALAYIGVIFFATDAGMLAHIPAFLGAMAMLIGVAAPILGIASWYRGKMQADPSIPTSNRG